MFAHITSWCGQPKIIEMPLLFAVEHDIRFKTLLENAVDMLLFFLLIIFLRQNYMYLYSAMSRF